MPDVRPSPIAGQWYEADATVLARTVDSYIEDAQVPVLEGPVVAVIAPHAGHRYSGAVAGYAFAPLRGESPDLVAMIAPMHHPHNDSLLTTAHDAYQTPLGEIPVDRDAVRELDEGLRAEAGLGLAPVSGDKEHSLEIELPFLQRALASEWTLLPVMVRARDPRVSEALGKGLAAVLRERNFALVASTDLSHFYEHQTALRYDRAMLGAMESFDPAAAFDLERAGRGFACGLNAFTAVMWAARDLGADRVRVLRHATSAEATGDYASVVGYAAAVIMKEN